MAKIKHSVTADCINLWIWLAFSYPFFCLTPMCVIDLYLLTMRFPWFSDNPAAICDGRLIVAATAISYFALWKLNSNNCRVINRKEEHCVSMTLVWSIDYLTCVVLIPILWTMNFWFFLHCGYIQALIWMTVPHPLISEHPLLGS